MGKLHVLIYKMAEGYIEKRKPHRPAHFDHIKKYSPNGEMIMGGALGEPVDSGLMVFKNMDMTKLKEFAQSDPYVLNGVAISWEIKVWHEVISELLK